MNYAIFNKPSRYIGNEINIIRKDPEMDGAASFSDIVKVALCFPDTYEIGMSHLGLKILYSIINSIPYACAERIYAPWDDFESYLRQNRLPLTSLENRRPLKDFDIAGFTLQYELSYTNVLNMLDLGGIPVKAADRKNKYPIIIAGGPCAVNPLPLAPFIDAFVIGDGEEVIREIIEIFSRVKGQGSGVGDKSGLLNTLSKLEGVYVPVIHDPDKKKIKRIFIENLDRAPFPDVPLLPYMSIVHDRANIEVARGCTRGCRFCQAGMIYRPLRERSLENVLSLAQKSILNTGYEEVSFTSLSAGDYTDLLPLIRKFNRLCSGSHTAVSLPSLRVGAINSDVLQEIKSVRKTGFTIAPEAGTQRLRNVINKDLTYEEYNETLKKFFTAGWSSIKLYFMIGLPTETMEDIDGLIDMAARAFKKGREIIGGRININVGISAFVPKAHTPFQWKGQSSFEELRRKQDFIRRAFGKKRINFKGQHVEHSLLEAVFSRADKDSALLLETAWRLGCRFDGWSESFNFENWKLAAEKTGIDLYDYASRSFELDKELPWDFIDTGITKKFLKSEYERALKEKITSDCRSNCCGCGLECKDRAQITEHRLQNLQAGTRTPELVTRNTQHAIRSKLRVRFSKTGILSHLSHQELMTSISRAVSRAKIPVAYSSGFHPHSKISFGPALAVGVEGLNEYFDIELSSLISASEFLARLNSVLPEGLKALHAVAVPLNEKSLNDLISCYKYEIIIDNAMKKHINLFMSRQSCPLSRDKKTVDIRPMVERVEIYGDKLQIMLTDTDNAKVRLYEILQEMLKRTVEEIQSALIKRIDLYGYNNIKRICL